MRRLIVLGTGTGVGKTHVSVALVRALRARAPSLPVLALKPVETGLGEGTVSDAQCLADAAGIALPGHAYGFTDPISPHLAAARAGVRIDVTRAVAWIDNTIRDTALSEQSWCLVETAGGVFSPLAPTVTNFELARALEPAVWLLVAPDALGVLHDVTATLEAMKHRGRTPDHVVLSAARGVDASTGTNATELARLGIAEPSAVLGPDGAWDLGPLVDRLLAVT